MSSVSGFSDMLMLTGIAILGFAAPAATVPGLNCTAFMSGVTISHRSIFRYHRAAAIMSLVDPVRFSVFPLGRFNPCTTTSPGKYLLIISKYLTHCAGRRSASSTHVT